MPIDARQTMLASFHHDVSAHNIDELIPPEDYERLPESWAELSSGQQRGLVTLFDVYSERLWDQYSPIAGVRSLTETGWRRCVRDLFVHGPKLQPMVPFHLTYSLYKKAALARPESCPMPAFSKRERKEATRTPPPHVDFVGFISLLSTVADQLREHSDPPPSFGPMEMAAGERASTGALSSLLHLVATGADHPDAEEMMEQRDWDLIFNTSVARCLQPSRGTLRSQTLLYVL